jgi:ADP-ribose pyrophosphatase YjhB (NUDIX family)
MNKRVSARGIIFESDHFYAILRRRKQKDNTYKEYYVIPGGVVEHFENLEKAIIRELKEELSVDIEINGYLGRDEGEKSIAHFFSCRIIKGTPKLGGEEQLKNNPDNYYEIQKININDLGNIDLLGKEFILKSYNKEFTENEKVERI